MTAPAPDAHPAVTGVPPEQAAYETWQETRWPRRVPVPWNHPATAKSREAWRAAAKAGAARERERADKAEAELAALGDRIDAVIAVKAAAERERAERAESALSDALLRLAHGDAELHARLLADAGYGSLPDCGGRETERSGS